MQRRDASNAIDDRYTGTPGGGSRTRLLRRIAGAGAAALLVVNVTANHSSQAFSGQVHADLNRTGFATEGSTSSSLRDSILLEMDEASAELDDKFNGTTWAGDDDKHFDDCEFDDGVTFINARYRGAATALKPVKTGSHVDPPNPFAAAYQFGTALHTIQDLYSHSNWVELGFPADGDQVVLGDLIDLSNAHLGVRHNWQSPGGGNLVRGDILLGENDWAPDEAWTVRVPPGQPKVPVLYRDAGFVVGRLLVTGEGFEDDECNITRGVPSPGPGQPGSYEIVYDGFEHSFLHKDGYRDGTAEPYLLHQKAAALARLQTSYEWCRLVHNAGQAGNDGLLLTTWVRSGGNPHPTGTPCANQTNSGLPPEPDTTAVTVTVETVTVLDAQEDGDIRGKVQVAFALYDHPSVFHTSKHYTTPFNESVLDNTVLDADIPPMTVCIPVGARTTFAVYGWENDDPDDDRWVREFDDRGNADDVMIGFQTRVDRAGDVGTRTTGNDDLRVTYRVEHPDNVPRCSNPAVPPPVNPVIP